MTQQHEKSAPPLRVLHGLGYDPERSDRPILTAPVGKDGLFIVPKKFTAEDEVTWAKRRLDW